MRAQALGAVAGDAELDGHRGGAADVRQQGVGVRGRDFATRKNLVAVVEVGDLVARGEECDLGGPVHQRLPVGDRGEHAELRGPQGGAGGEHGGAFTDVLALVAYVAPLLRRGDNGHPTSVWLGVLLANDGIGAGGQRGAGEDARRFARTHRFGGEAARGHRLDDAQLDARAARDVRPAHGVAVHRGVVPRRQVHGARHVLGEHQVERLAQGAALGRQRAEVLEDELRRF